MAGSGVSHTRTIAPYITSQVRDVFNGLRASFIAKRRPGILTSHPPDEISHLAMTSFALLRSRRRRFSKRREDARA
jgi:hypothetical protein